MRFRPTLCRYIYQEVGGAGGISVGHRLAQLIFVLVPALKNVTFTSRNGYAHGLVDMQLGMTVRIITFGFTVHTHSVTCIVIKPNNERRSVSLLGFIYSNQSDGISCVIINIGRGIIFFNSK